MKTFITALYASVFLFAACNQNKPTESTDSTAQEDSTKPTKQCYQATVKTDSASLSYETINGKVVGTLAFNFAEKDDSKGEIKGEFKGDTLFVDYVFRAEGTTSKNPLVFLKSGNELKQGYGEITTYLGKTYFKDRSQLKFEDGFLFKPVDCK